MKIKSVKITGFRAFEKEEDSTFDFTKGGEIMNFNSIYAPNGFGKTSFYDAVEWGVTHKIQRFDRMVDFEKVRKDNDAPLLLNKASLSGKVIVETSSQKFENIINKKKVYKYNEKPENEYFQNQILTQDLIDAFLKEEKADKRYENFLEIDNDLKKYDQAYKKINTLLGYIDDQKKELKSNKNKEEEKLQGEFDFEEEFKKFDEINEVISSLIKASENLHLIDRKTFNQTVYDNLSRNIDVRLLSLKEELIKTKLNIDAITIIRDGEKSEDGKLIGGLLNYLDNKSKISKLDKQLQELNQIVKWFGEQENFERESKSNDADLKYQQSILDKALNIEKQFETFLSIQNEINNLEQDIKISNDKLLNAKREALNAENRKKNATLKIDELKSSIESNRSRLNNIPEQQNQFELTSRIINESQEKIKDLSKSINKAEKKQNDLKLILDEFGYYENKINDDVELLLEFKLFNEHIELVNQYLSAKNELEKLQKDIQEIQIKIDNQNKLNKELNDFINSGLELVHKSQSSDCPLCNHNYPTFEKLSESILSNKLLDDLLKKLLEEKTETELTINKLLSKLSVDKETIFKVFSSVKEPYSIDARNTKNELDKLVFSRTENLDKLNNNQSTLNTITLSLGDFKSFDGLSVDLQNKISALDSQIAELSNQIAKEIEATLQEETKIKLAEEQIALFKKNVLKQKESSLYALVIGFFIEELRNDEISKDKLTVKITSLNQKIQDLNSSSESLRNKLKSLKSNLSNYPLEKGTYIEQIKTMHDDKIQILQSYESYENNIQSEFDLIIMDMDKSQIESAFVDLIKTQKEIEKNAETKIEKYKVVRILNDACIKTTESKKVQDKINEITNSLQDLDNSEEMLKTEKGNLKLYLKNTIESYFYTPLINAIYRKIDPHPDYKSIEFECDFAENKPRLQIYTVNNSGDKNVPSLYFSTAQVNILSLSIFLARALKTTDDNNKSVDCIFIDDPIQSMDSINILSFIDLFRGLTLSLDKQLIVSTHEENFHLLLKKKIPADLFKSKFLEFETFGKLKPENIN